MVTVTLSIFYEKAVFQCNFNRLNSSLKKLNKKFYSAENLHLFKNTYIFIQIECVSILKSVTRNIICAQIIPTQKRQERERIFIEIAYISSVKAIQECDFTTVALYQDVSEMTPQL